MKFSLDILGKVRDAYADWDEPENVLFLSRKAWRASLALAVLLSVCGILYGVYVLFSSLTLLEEAATPTHFVASTALDRAKLERIVQALQARQGAFDAAKGVRPAAADPSL